jgi:flagellar assembly factor FliW
MTAKPSTFKVQTSRFGEIEIRHENVLKFKSGLIGFPDTLEFGLYISEEEAPFEWLQSLEDPKLAFVVIKPEHIAPEYQFSIPKVDLEDLKVNEGEGAEVRVVVTVPSDPHDMTANLRAPILIHPETKDAKQIILSYGDFSTRFQIMDPNASVKEVVSSPSVLPKTKAEKSPRTR